MITSINLSDYRPKSEITNEKTTEVSINNPLLIKDPLPNKIYYPRPDVLIRAELSLFESEKELLDHLKKIQSSLEKLGHKPTVRIITSKRYLDNSHTLNTCFLSSTLRYPWTRDFSNKAEGMCIGINIKKISDVDEMIRLYKFTLQHEIEFNDDDFEIKMIC